MKKVLWIISAALFILELYSCKKFDRSGEPVKVSNVTLSFKDTNGEVLVPADSNYTKSPSGIDIPLRITFSDAVPRRFTVNVSSDPDTINALIAEQKLTNAVLLPSERYSFPSTADILFGEDHYDLDLHVDMTAIEIHYGETLALAVTLSDPTKNNSINPSGKTVIVLINTSDIIKPSEIHYVYFTDAGMLSMIPKPNASYQQSATDLYVPVSVSLGSTAGDAFTADLGPLPDTVQQLISDSVLKNTILLRADTDYTLPPTVNFLPKSNLATFNIDFSANTLRQYYYQKVALALKLSNPSSHLLDTTRDVLVLVLEPQKLVDLDITNDGSTLSVERENTQTGEISPNLVDNNINTKYLLFNFQGVWAQLAFNTPEVANAYTLTSANDHDERDPDAWQLQASQDGNNWVVLDSESGQVFTARFQTKQYDFNNTIAYKYYRLNVLSVKGGNGGLFQLAEWRLIKTPQ